MIIFSCTEITCTCQQTAEIVSYLQKHNWDSARTLGMRVDRPIAQSRLGLYREKKGVPVSP